MYCPHCGNALAEPEVAEAEAAGELAGGLADAAESASTAEVEIARIQADRDVTLAKIERGLVADMTEAAVAEDAVKAELLDEVLAPPEAEAEPLVIAEAEAEAEAEPDTAPPDVVESSVPEPAARGSSNPWW